MTDDRASSTREVIEHLLDPHRPPPPPDFIFELAGFDAPDWKKGEPMGARFAASAPRGYHLHEWSLSRDGMTLVICWERDFI